MHVGRFEVTRAQFAAFDPRHVVEPGRENYPANGVTFEQAQAYAAWLNKNTGRTYRLPLLLEQTSGGTESDRLGCCRGDDVALVFTDGFPSRSTFGRRRKTSTVDLTMSSTASGIVHLLCFCGES